jgi:hypothetical protein
MRYLMAIMTTNLNRPGDYWQNKKPDSFCGDSFCRRWLLSGFAVTA